MKQKNAGFTLVELLMVIVLVAIISGLSVSFYARFYNQNNVASTVDQLVGSLHKAQSYAQAGKRGTNWGVYKNVNQLVLFSGTSYATRTTALDEKTTIPSNVSITGLTEVVFMHSTGTPSATPNMTISGGGNSKIVSINSEGVVNK